MAIFAFYNYQFAKVIKQKEEGIIFPDDGLEMDADKAFPKRACQDFFKPFVFAVTAFNILFVYVRSRCVRIVPEKPIRRKTTLGNSSLKLSTLSKRASRILLLLLS